MRRNAVAVLIGLAAGICFAALLLGVAAKFTRGVQETRRVLSRQTSRLTQNPAHTEVRLDASEIPSGAMKYTVLVRNIPSGIHGSWRAGKNAWHFHFEYNDQGFGPWIEESILVSDQGIPVSVRVMGHDFMESSVEESFSLTKGTAVWSDSAGRGEKLLQAPAFYLTRPVVEGQMSAVPEELALLARALLATPDKKLALLPQGEAHIERIGEMQLSSGKQTKKLTQFKISGFASGPVPIWLEQDATLFALFEDQIVLIRRNWESTLPEIKRQMDTRSLPVH